MYNTLMKRKLFRMNDLDPKFINNKLYDIISFHNGVTYKGMKEESLYVLSH